MKLYKCQEHKKIKMSRKNQEEMGHSRLIDILTPYSEFGGRRHFNVRF